MKNPKLIDPPYTALEVAGIVWMLSVIGTFFAIGLFITKAVDFGGSIYGLYERYYGESEFFD